MQDLKDNMVKLMVAMTIDLVKDTKASEARVRKNTLEFGKLAKQYRKDSVAARK